MVNPLSQNLYTYVYNNPLIYTDPTGHYTEDDDEIDYDERDASSLHGYSKAFEAAEKEGNKALMQANHDAAIALRQKYGVNAQRINFLGDTSNSSNPSLSFEVTPYEGGSEKPELKFEFNNKLIEAGFELKTFEKGFEAKHIKTGIIIKVGYAIGHAEVHAYAEGDEAGAAALGAAGQASYAVLVPTGKGTYHETKVDVSAGGVGAKFVKSKLGGFSFHIARGGGIGYTDRIIIKE